MLEGCSAFDAFDWFWMAASGASLSTACETDTAAGCFPKVWPLGGGCWPGLREKFIFLDELDLREASDACASLSRSAFEGCDLREASDASLALCFLSKLCAASASGKADFRDAFDL